MALDGPETIFVRRLVKLVPPCNHVQALFLSQEHRSRSMHAGGGGPSKGFKVLELFLPLCWLLELEGERDTTKGTQNELPRGSSF